MSVRSYRAAVARYRVALDLLGPYRGPCGLCGGHPDARHRQGDAITGGLVGGDSTETVAGDYLPDDCRDAVRVALEVAVATLAADRRMHGLTAAKAAGIDQDVWATEQ